MTIREYIKRRVYWCAAVGFGGWLICALSVATSRDKQYPLFFTGGIVCFAGAILALQWIVRCPKCEARLAHTVGMAVAFQWGIRGTVNFCPYCGVSLDEPVPHADPVAESQNPIK